MPFSKYAEVKDKLCIHYVGHNPDYLVQLKALRPSFEKAFPEISFIFTGRNIVWLDEDPTTDEFGYTINVLYDASEEVHPILNLIKESSIPVQKCPHVGKGDQYGIICPHGNFPTKSLTSKQIEQLKTYVEKQSLKPVILKTLDEKARKEQARNAGMVVGVECDVLFEAVYAGRPTALVPTVLGQELYEMLAEKPIVLHLDQK